MVYSEKGKVEEWESQLNTYAHILRENDIPVTGLKIFALFKDWNRRGFNEAFKKGRLWKPWKETGYPEKEWAYFSLPLWSPDRAREYVIERVALHQAAEKELPLCTTKEIWSGNRCTIYCPCAPFCQQYKESKKTGLSQST
jgi:hypothetical protein